MALVDTEELRDTVTATVGDRFLEALAARDFTRMSECFDPAATMQALLPPELVECQGATQIVENVRSWFGDTGELELLDSSIGEIGDRLHVAWRLRLHPTPWGDDAWHVIEQQAYLRAGDHIEAIDLVCSGFHPDVRS
jgi:hypothetical protein